MSRVDNFRKVPVKIPYKSGFDKSYRHTLTGTTGTLVPIFCDEVLPNQDSYLRIPFVLRMPPLATDTFMNVDYKMEAFFVPTRLLMASNSYEKFMTGDTDINYNSSGSTITKKVRTPVVAITSSDSPYYVGPGTLADYLGFKSVPLAGFTYNICAFPFLAYHLIYENWYRSSLIQQTIFSNVVTSGYANDPSVFNTVIPSDYSSVGYSLGLSDPFADSIELGSLRQRNFGADYFSVATPRPQNGPSIGIALTVDTNVVGETYPDNNTLGVHIDSNRDPQYWQQGSNVHIDTDLGSVGVTRNGSAVPTSGFTISSLRLANSLECFLERNNISGNRFVDFLKANYGSDLKDGVAQRPVYLGSASFPVYTSGVMANGEPDPSGISNNPFNSVASQYGTAHAEGSDFVVKFHSDEPGYLMVIGSLVPDVTYGSGVDRMFMRYVKPDSRTDMANHLLQNVGPQPIFHSEAIKIVDSTAASAVFGYVDRYADWMTKNNKLSGELHDGESLESFALQRNFNTAVISNQFLQIPTTFLDQVMAVTVANSKFTYWIDCYFEYKVSMPLSRYSIPSLQDPAYEHGDTVWLNRGGVRID